MRRCFIRGDSLALPLFVGLIACSPGGVGQEDGPAGGAGVPDAGAGDPGEGDPEVPPSGDCDDAVVTGLPSGKHNAGKVCLDCHDGDGAAPRWTAAGTIYSTVDGASPLAGATIHLEDASGAEVVLVSAQNGNFWTQEELAFPLTVRASRCPTERAMGGAVPDSGASCNSCHDSAMRIALP